MACYGFEVDALLCRCLVVRESEVVAAVRRGADTVAAVGEACEAGQGCGSCHFAISAVIGEQRERARRRPAPESQQLSFLPPGS